MINFHWRDNPSRWFAPGVGNWKWAWNCCCTPAESVFCFAGLDTSFTLRRTDEYTASDTWVNRATMPTDMVAHGACTLGSLGYAIGGVGTSSRSTLQYTKPATDSWATKTAHPTPSRSTLDAAVAINGKGYLFYGSDSTPTFYQDCDEYSPDPSDSWASKTDGPAPARSTGGSAATATAGYFMGGVNTVSFPSPFMLADNDEYTAASDSWASKTDIPSPLRRAAVLEVLGALIYAMGGNDNSSTVGYRDTDEYDTAVDSWTAKTDMPTPPRSFAQAAPMSGAIYLHGGSTSTGTLLDNDEYTPDTWVSKTDMTAGHQNGASTTL